ncbi:thermonuclease family protein [Nitratireductor basaltis]|uniref:Nuclease (SNase-like) protein n=1 Tax=Nitratireductor basaltis TaxID=472175 RepID=A0A084U6M9_9HYPH|nr:thermonuclease family protein [Nitratireductor basaltis]KFB08615.1 Nuclease (SNase-like) protein [Nitratireductor basaltis]
MLLRRLSLPILAFLLPAIAHAGDDEALPGPVPADVVRVLDGDTFEARAHIWPGQTVQVLVRLRGIDAPEIRSSCAPEKLAGITSRTVLEKLIAGRRITISNISGGKYYGRVIADAATENGQAISAYLLERSVVRPYHGGRRERSCQLFAGG